MKKYVYNLLFTGLLTLSLTACGGSGGSGGGSGGGSSNDFECPATSNNVTWTSYGKFTFQKSGDDSTARTIITKCGWHVHKGHNGGIDDTLQVASANEEVILVWAYNIFYAFRVTGGWTGLTERGVKIGDHITTLYAKYPGFMTSDGTHHFLEEGSDISVSVTSDVHGFIEEIIVGFYFKS